MSFTPTKFRNAVINQFEYIFKKHNFKNYKKLAKEVEIGIFNRFNLEVHVGRIDASPYFHLCIHIYSHLESDSYIGNSNLINRIKKNKIKAIDLAYMSYKELFPEKWAEIDSVLMKEFNTSRHVGIKTNQYTCSKCRKNNCSFYELQTRSGDESMTIFIRCLECDHAWRN
jgi:DNA-directed RNA polymerase subunit M/transcription elongation factor TFIIS